MDELRAIVMRAGATGTETGLPRVAMVRGEVPPEQLAAIYEPMVNVVLQGSKTITIGDRVMHYDPASYFVISVDVPATGEVRQGGPDAPYLAVALTLEPASISAMIADLPVGDHKTASTGFSVAPITPELIDAWLRLMRLMDRPQEAPILAPMIEREILFRVLLGPQGSMLRQIVRADSRLSQVKRAIGRIRARYDEPFRVEEIAAEVGLSVSAFHRHFRAITAMSPIQYQKQVRLLEARRLLASGSGNATSAAFAVGYESASQFSREYARAFGAPPSRDPIRIRAGTIAD